MAIQNTNISLQFIKGLSANLNEENVPIVEG